MTPAQQTELDVAEKAVVVAAKAWASMGKTGYSNRPLINSVRRLQDLESAAIRALPGRGKKEAGAE